VARSPGAEPRIFTTSALERRGIEELWRALEQFLERQKASGAFDERRREQLGGRLRRALERDFRRRVDEIESSGRLATQRLRVEAGEATFEEAVQALWQELGAGSG
jgi:putative protein kinase ArgK-like GTPase of G3E family